MKTKRRNKTNHHKTMSSRNIEGGAFLKVNYNENVICYLPSNIFGNAYPRPIFPKFHINKKKQALKINYNNYKYSVLIIYKINNSWYFYLIFII